MLIKGEQANTAAKENLELSRDRRDDAKGHFNSATYARRSAGRGDGETLVNVCHVFDWFTFVSLMV